MENQKAIIAAVNPKNFSNSYRCLVQIENESGFYEARDGWECFLTKDRSGKWKKWKIIDKKTQIEDERMNGSRNVIEKDLLGKKVNISAGKLKKDIKKEGKNNKANENDKNIVGSK